MKQYSNLFAHIHTVIPSTAMGSRFQPTQSGTWQPPVDIYERDSGLVILVELPGVDRDRIKVEVHNGQLLISGHRPNHLPEATRHVLHMEIPYGAYARMLRLPDWADSERIEAEYTDGYLTICIPRKGSE